MKKAPEAFRTISEVSDLLATPAHVLRFWESKFYQIRPVKRAGGRRYYRPDDVALINGIRILLQDRGLTIRGVQRVLQEKGLRHVIETGADLPLGAEIEAPEAAVIEAEAVVQLPPPAPPSLVKEIQADDEPAHHPALVAQAPEAAPAAPAGVARNEVTPPEAPRLAQLLRRHPREGFGARRDHVALVARRLDSLLDRMAEASGGGRW